MSLNEVRILDRQAGICKLKQFWGKDIYQTDIILPKPTFPMLEIMLKNSTNGLWFHPLNKWVSLNWLKNNNYNAIADRVVYLTSIYDDSKRYMVIKRKSNDNLLLSHVETAWIKKQLLCKPPIDGTPSDIPR